MKKKIIILTVFGLLLTACNKGKDISKNLRCEKNEDVLENKVNEVVSATFENDEIKSADIKIETIVADKYIDYIDVLEEDLKTKYEDYYNKQGIDISMSVSVSSIITKINIDFSLLDDASKNILNLSSTISTYEETKNSFQASGYLCN